MADFGSGLGALIGGNMASNDLENALAANAGTASTYAQKSDPYNSFGKSFLGTASTGIAGVQQAADKTMGYNDFMSSYTNTPAAQYQLQQADQVQNNSAAARGGLLSGSNLRSLATINNGIVAQNANAAYDEYLKGNNQQFGQLETALGNMFSAIGVGQTAVGQQDQLAIAQMNNTAKIADSQAKNDQGKGSGLGSMFSSVATLPFMF